MRRSVIKKTSLRLRGIYITTIAYKTSRRRSSPPLTAFDFKMRSNSKKRGRVSKGSDDKPVQTEKQQKPFSNDSASGKLVPEVWINVEPRLSEMLLFHLLDGKRQQMGCTYALIPYRWSVSFSIQSPILQQLFRFVRAKIIWEGVKFNVIPFDKIPRRPTAHISLPIFYMNKDRLVQFFKTPGSPWTTGWLSRRRNSKSTANLIYSAHMEKPGGTKKAGYKF